MLNVKKLIIGPIIILSCILGSIITLIITGIAFITNFL